MFTRTCISRKLFSTKVCSFVSNQVHTPKLSMSTSATLGTNESSRDMGPSKSRTVSSSPARNEYLYIEDVEDLDRYQPGGYHPVQIGDELNDGRYRIVNKLGYGGYSTVWLARDQQMAKYAAVKILTADSSDCTHEANLLSSLGNSSSRSGRGIIPSLIDQFVVTGPNGKHRCIVTPAAQMSLSDAKDASIYRLFQPKVAQSIVAQLIRGVAFLHSQNIVHGDLHLGNILVQFPEAIDRFSISELNEKFGEPESEAVVRVDGKPIPNGVPAHVFLPCWNGVRAKDLALGDDKIILSDFGESFNPEQTPRFFSNTLTILQPPEARFSDEPLSFASDIWTLACTIWEICGQRSLFDTFFPAQDSDTTQQIEVLGILLPEWWEKWARTQKWFNEENPDAMPEISKDLEGVPRTWSRRFEYSIQEPRTDARLEIMAEEERRVFEAMLWPMLRYQPRERATAQHALQSGWMKGWGLPALEQSAGSLKHAVEKERKV